MAFILREIVDLKGLGKSFDYAPSIESKTSIENLGDLFLAVSCSYEHHNAWLIGSGAYFHMTPHKKWFSDNEKINGGQVFLGDNSTYKIKGQGRAKLRLKDIRTKTLPKCFAYSRFG